MVRLRLLQILRFVAALAVAQSHASGILHHGRSVGLAGVDVFFVISGYIVTICARERPEGFLRKRLVRVLPLYYLVSAPYLWFGLTNGAPREKIIATLTLWPAYSETVSPLLPIAWSLSFELMFYLALALVIGGVRPALLIVAWGICATWGLLEPSPLLELVGSPLVLEFLAGAALAFAGTARRPQLGVAAIVLSLIGFACVEAGHLAALDDRAYRVALLGTPALLLVWGGLQIERLLPDRFVRPFVFLGDASYSLYLTHVMSLLVAWELGVKSEPALLAVAVAAAACTYLGLERPLLGLCRVLIPPAAGASVGRSDRQPAFQAEPSE